jgi:haloacetate dehalogenase
MDICPTNYMYRTTDKEMASNYFHFFFFIQPAPFPETLIGRGVDETLTFSWDQ